MSEEREELIAKLRSLAVCARTRDCRVGKHDAARFEQAADLLAQQETSGWREPEGWKLVPVEPDQSMVLIATREHVGAERYARDHEYCDAQIGPKLRTVYANMLAAAPSPPSSQETT